MTRKPLARCGHKFHESQGKVDKSVDEKEWLTAALDTDEYPQAGPLEEAAAVTPPGREIGIRSHTSLNHAHRAFAF